MPKVLLICAHRPQRSPSQRYRFEQYLPFLEKHGLNFTWSYLLHEKDDRLFYANGGLFTKVFILLKSVFIRLKDIIRLKKFDLIFIQREASFLGSSFFEKSAFRSGVPVIFDFDDSIWLEDTSPGNKKWSWIKKPEKFFNNLRYANHVIAGNAYLADKARPYNNKVTLIPTTIDTTFHIPKAGLRNTNTVVIGWSGSVSTVKHFEMLLPVLQRLQNKYGKGLRFKLLGDAAYKNALIQVEAKAWTEQTEVDELNSFDIGIMPLPNDEWTRGKCGLKGLSYMACGIATVMSDVGVNHEIIKQGQNGFLAGDHEQWFSILCSLIENKTLREALGTEARETVLNNYSVAVYKNIYLDLYNATAKTDPK